MVIDRTTACNCIVCFRGTVLNINQTYIKTKNNKRGANEVLGPDIFARGKVIMIPADLEIAVDQENRTEDQTFGSVPDPKCLSVHEKFGKIFLDSYAKCTFTLIK